MNAGNGEKPEVTGNIEKDGNTEYAETLSVLLTATPNLRASFFADPTRQVGKSLPPAKSWVYGTGRDWGWLPWYWPSDLFRYRQARKHLAQDVLQEMKKRVTDSSQGQAITASINTDSVFAEYFAPIVKVSLRSFSTVYVLSLAAFAVGIGLIAVGAYVAISPPSGTDSTVVASVFGGTGAFSALGSVYTMAKSGIREVTNDHTRVSLVLTSFATQLGQLRTIIERSDDGKDSLIVNPEMQSTQGAGTQSTQGAGTQSSQSTGTQSTQSTREQRIKEAKLLNKCIEKSMKAALKEIPITDKSSASNSNKPSASDSNKPSASDSNKPSASDSKDVDASSAKDSIIRNSNSRFKRIANAWATPRLSNADK
jgi:hypothetical protein